MTPRPPMHPRQTSPSSPSRAYWQTRPHRCCPGDHSRPCDSNPRTRPSRCPCLRVQVTVFPPCNSQSDTLLHMPQSIRSGTGDPASVDDQPLLQGMMAPRATGISPEFTRDASYMNAIRESHLVIIYGRNLVGLTPRNDTNPNSTSNPAGNTPQILKIPSIFLGRIQRDRLLIGFAPRQETK